jgi:hypothetical protein
MDELVSFETLLTTRLHGIITQKTEFLMVTAVGTINFFLHVFRSYLAQCLYQPQNSLFLILLISILIYGPLSAIPRYPSPFIFIRCVHMFYHRLVDCFVLMSHVVCKSELGNRLFWLGFVMDIITPSRKMPG